MLINHVKAEYNLNYLKVQPSQGQIQYSSPTYLMFTQEKWSDIIQNARGKKKIKLLYHHDFSHMQHKVFKSQMSFFIEAFV